MVEQYRSYQFELSSLVMELAAQFPQNGNPHWSVWPQHSVLTADVELLTMPYSTELQ